MKDILKQESGFTLVEVLVAMFLVAIGLLAVATMPVTVIRGNSQAQHITESSFNGMGEIEQLMILENTQVDLAAGAHGPVNVAGNSGVTYSVSWTVADTTAYTKNVSVSVSWTDKGASKQSQFAYVKTDFM